MAGTEQAQRRAQMRARRKANRKMKQKPDGDPAARATKKLKTNHRSSPPRRTGADATTNRRKSKEKYDDDDEPLGMGMEKWMVEKRRRSHIIRKSKQKPPDDDEATKEKKQRMTAIPEKVVVRQYYYKYEDSREHDRPPEKAVLPQSEDEESSKYEDSGEQDRPPEKVVLPQSEDAQESREAVVDPDQYYYYSSSEEDEESREQDRRLGHCLIEMARLEDEEKKRVRNLYSRNGSKPLIEEFMVRFRNNILEIERLSLELHRRLEAKFDKAAEKWRPILTSMWNMDGMRNFLNTPLSDRPHMWEHPDSRASMIAQIYGDDPLSNPYRCLHITIDPETGFSLTPFSNYTGLSKEHDKLRLDFQRKLYARFEVEPCDKSSHHDYLSKGEELLDSFNKDLPEDLKIAKEDLHEAVKDFLNKMRDKKMHCEARKVLIKCAFQSNQFTLEQWVCAVFEDYTLEKFVDSLRRPGQKKIMKRINRYCRKKLEQGSRYYMTLAKYLEVKLKYADKFGF